MFKLMSKIPPQLNAVWNAWLSIMQQMASAHAFYRPVSAAQYQTVYRSLLDECRRLQLVGDPVVAETARDMEAFVDSWCSLDVLQHTDPKLLRKVILEGAARFGRRLTLPKFTPESFVKPLKIMAGVILAWIAWRCWSEPDFLDSIIDGIFGAWDYVINYVDRNQRTLFGLAFVFAGLVAWMMNQSRRF